jgi:hypothetical protein
MGYWKTSDFTKAELEKVNQEQFEDELYVLRHSPAARAMFAKAQYHLTVGEDDSCLLGTAMDMFGAVNEIACEVAHRHPIAYSQWNPRRKWVPGVGKFYRLAEALGFESEENEYGETFVRTIDGWWAV